MLDLNKLAQLADEALAKETKETIISWLRERMEKAGINNNQLMALESSLPISKVVFFHLKDGKYLTSSGEEITTEFLMSREHKIYHDGGFVIIER